MTSEIAAIIVSAIVGISVPVTVAIIKLLPKKNGNIDKDEAREQHREMLDKILGKMKEMLADRNDCLQFRVCEEKFKSMENGIRALQVKIEENNTTAAEERKELRGELHELRDVVQRWLAHDGVQESRRRELAQ